MGVRLTDLETAKGHLRITDDASDDIIISKLEQASGFIIDFCKVDSDYWDQDSSESVAVPVAVEAATLLVMEALFDGTEPLSPSVKSLLQMHRDPALT